MLRCATGRQRPCLTHRPVPLILRFPYKGTGAWQIDSSWVEKTEAQRDRHAPLHKPEQLIGPPWRARIMQGRAEGNDIRTPSIQPKQSAGAAAWLASNHARSPAGEGKLVGLTSGGTKHVSTDPDGGVDAGSPQNVPRPHSAKAKHGYNPIDGI